VRLFGHLLPLIAPPALIYTFVALAALPFLLAHPTFTIFLVLISLCVVCASLAVAVVFVMVKHRKEAAPKGAKRE